MTLIQEKITQAKNLAGENREKIVEELRDWLGEESPR